MSNDRKICIVAPVHEWDDVRVFHKQAVTIAAEGHSVVLLAQVNQVLEHKGVTVKQVWSLRTPRWLRFLLLPFVFVQTLREHADVYHLHNPDTLPLAIALKLLGKTVVYDTHEDFSQRILSREWVPAIFKVLLSHCVSWLECFVAGIVDASIATQDDVAKRLGHGTVVIGNAPRVDQHLIEEVEKLASTINDDFEGLRAIYIGSISFNRGVLEMIDAIEQANFTTPVRLWLIGPSSKVVLDTARARVGWQYVDYLERQGQEIAFSYVARADVGLITIRDVGDHRKADPNKIYEYLTFGVPFIASDFPAWRKRLSSTDAGWFVPPEDVQSLADTLVSLASSPNLRAIKGKRGRQFVANYNWENESRRLLEIYKYL